MLSKKFDFLYLIVLAVFYFIFSITPFSQTDKIKSFDKYLTEYFFNKRVPSISAGVLRDNKIVWLGVKGIADLEYLTFATYNSVYRIASISKPITATAILQLNERGLINLDTDVRKYVPSFPEKKWKITIRQLLNHTSGIRSYKEGEFHSKKYYANANEAIKVFAYDSLNFEPGTKYEYTSLGYTLLAAVVENLTKGSFEDYLVKNIFIPAEMKNTTVDKQKLIIPNRVRGYEKNFERKFENAPLADLSIKVAGGGLLSNAEDLLLFSKALLGNKLISPKSFEMMTAPTRLKNGSKIDYGFGFALSYEGDSLKTISHTGGGTGFTTMLLIYPKEKIATVHLINISDRNLGLPAVDLAKIEFGLPYTNPTRTISDDLMYRFQSSGIDSTILVCGAILDSNSTSYNISESELVFFAKDLIGLNKIADAIQYLKFLVKRYPRSFAIQVALADTYLKDNNNGLALRHYRIAWQINSKNQYVNRKIKELSK
jgi:CubicO group peptidase (beta-lactamase class C family)